MSTDTTGKLSAILKLVHQYDWADESFCEKKAQVCSELSAIVYEDVTEYELKNASRIHLFASDAFREIVKRKKPNSIQFNPRELENQVFLSRGSNAVVLGVVTRDVIILAVRGTVKTELWDWKTNVDSRKYNLSQSLSSCFFFEQGMIHYRLDDIFFHRGFFEAIVPQFSAIAEEIKKITSTSKATGRKVIWTGHFLGGAMAAVAHAINDSDVVKMNPDLTVHAKYTNAYTFGMPRYCGLGAVCNFVNPFHIFRTQDLVPTIPMRRMGFSDVQNEHELTDNGKLILGVRTDSFGVLGHVPKLLTSLKSHSIESYADLLSKVTSIPRPK